MMINPPPPPPPPHGNDNQSLAHTYLKSKLITLVVVIIIIIIIASFKTDEPETHDTYKSFPLIMKDGLWVNCQLNNLC